MRTIKFRYANKIHLHHIVYLQCIEEDRGNAPPERTVTSAIFLQHIKASLQVAHHEVSISSGVPCYCF